LTFEGGGGVGNFGKKNPLPPPKEEKKNRRESAREKKKFLEIIDIFQWGGWLVQIPACSVTNLSAVFTSKPCSFE